MPLLSHIVSSEVSDQFSSMRAQTEAQSELVLMVISLFYICSKFSVLCITQNHLFDQCLYLTKNSDFATPGKPGRSPKNPNQIAPTYPPGYFERVFNIRSEIPRLWDILKEPSVRLKSWFWRTYDKFCCWITYFSNYRDAPVWKAVFDLIMANFVAKSLFFEKYRNAPV